MFGCFTRNIYVSKICLHFCVLLNNPMTVSRKGKIRSESGLWWGELVLPFQEAIRNSSSNVTLCFQKFLWSLGCSVLDVVKYVGGGGQNIFGVDSSSYPFFLTAYTVLLQSANLYMYIQAMFTEKYLHWCRLTFSQLSLLGMAWHTDCDISHLKKTFLIHHTMRSLAQSMLSDFIIPLKSCSFHRES